MTVAEPVGAGGLYLQSMISKASIIFNVGSTAHDRSGNKSGNTVTAPSGIL
jgi:hypothetical protein